MTKEKTVGNSMKMSQLAEASGLPVSTIKFYISQGLLPRPRKAKPNVAYYDQVFLKRLLIIKNMRSEGLAIKSMKSILEKYPFEKISDWEDFKEQAMLKESHDLEEVERLATLSDEERRTFAILDAAFHVFSVNGYHNATVDDIAQEAGVSKGTCYQYFESKEDIFIATIDRTLDKVITEAKASVGEEQDARAKLGMKGLTFISNFSDLQFMFIGLYSEILGGNERLRKKASEIQSFVVDFIVEDIELGIEQGVVRQVDSAVVSYALLGIAEVVANRFLLKEEFDVPEFFVNIMDFMQHGLSTPSDQLTD
ncbi:MAG: TetR family transcriptional regulator [Actinobacteria bacterium]|nr:TetR family transcriptional regulator [Actinomycetota bacterium]